MNLVSESAEAILHALADRERMSAVEFLRTVPGELSRGALYTLLARMVERGWIAAGERESTTPDARPTTRFQITGAGRRALAQHMQRKGS